ncbi:MAG: hypothetical protein IKK61_06835 [Clostridia bacterium]|nr:hypothetical protein [Clostridia bacterium]
MEQYLNPDFGVNIKRRAVLRAVTAAVLLFLLVSAMYGMLGWTLTVAVPENVTAVHIQRIGEVVRETDFTLTQPEDVAVFTQHLSGIGKLRDAHQSKYVWSSGAPYTITLHTADGSQMEYQIKDGMLQMEGSRWFWFPGYEELQDLILAYRPSNP